MAVTLITKNSVTASKRPTAAQLVSGELGLNYEASDPGLYFEDSAGNVRKVGGAHYSATAPNVTAAGQSGNSVGELWYNTGDDKLYIWSGTAWEICGGTDTQSFYEAGPWAHGTNRPDGQPLLPGDEWYDTSTTPITAYVWTGTVWDLTAANDTHSFAGAALPATVTTRPDTTALQDGDVYFDTTAGQERAYRYDLAGGAWVNADHRTFTQDTVPPAAASFDGDLWYDTSTLESYVYYDDGTSKQWVEMISSVGTSVASQCIRAAATPTTRTDGGALQDGDLWVDTTTTRTYVYNLGTTSWGPVGPHTFTQSTTPTSPYEGDSWYDDTTLELFFYVNDGTSTQWVQTF